MTVQHAAETVPAAAANLEVPAAASETRMIERLPFETDGGLSARARLGVVVLATDYTMEHEFRQVLARLPGVALYVARIGNSPTITPETLAAMEGGIAPAAALLLPGDRFDVVAFGCTSASMILGEGRVFELLTEAKPGAAPTTPITAAFAAFRALGARRIGVLTPYAAEVNATVQRYIQAAGYEIPVFGSFNEGHDPTVAAISPASLRAAARRVAEAAPVDAIFVACTSLRLLEAVDGIEAELGLPVTSSNHAMIWHCLRLAGITDAVPGFGRLFTMPLA